MGKIYFMKEYLLRRELKEARKELKNKLEQGSSFGYMLLDHYTIRQLNEKITRLEEEIKNEQQGHS